MKTEMEKKKKKMTGTSREGVDVCAHFVRLLLIVGISVNLYVNGAVPLQSTIPSVFSSSRTHPPTPSPALMSYTHPASSSSSNFQLIFNNALTAYEKHTKKDLLAHPLATELQSCSSPTAILAVLHQQVQELNRSRSGSEWLTKWLDPTVHVLYAFSGTLGEGVGLVRPKTRPRRRCAPSNLLTRYSHQRK
jgi:hypothetical protein